MPQVPYKGYPEGGPQHVPLRPDIPEAGLLAGARAVESLGRDLRGAGEEIWNQALHMKQLENRSEADQLNSAFTEEADLRRIEYQKLEGKNAEEGIPQYYSDLSSIRERYRKQASNPMVERFFNSESRGLEVRLKTSGATHAAGEFKKYRSDVLQSNIKSLSDQVAMFPKDDRLFEEKLGNLEEAVYENARLRGRDDDVAKQDFYDQRSLLTSKRVDALRRTNPIEAEQMKQKYLANGFIRGEDIAKIEERVRQSMYTTGARQVAIGQLGGGNLLLGSGKVPIAQAAQAIAAIETGGERGDPYKARGVETKHGRALGKYQVMPAFLPEFLREAGMPSMTPEEFLKSPEAQEELFKRRFTALMEKHGSFNEAARRWIGTGKADPLGTTPDAYIRKANGALAKNAPLSEHRRVAQEEAARLSDDPMYADYVDKAIVTHYNTNQAEVRDTAYRTMDTLKGLSAGIDMPGGKRPTTVEEITATPEGEAAWFQATKAQKAYILNHVLPRNSRGDHSFTEETYRDYAKLIGQANSPDPEDRKAFLETPMEAFMDKPWPFSKRDEVIKLQRKMRNQLEGNPHVAAALHTLAPMMNGIVDKRIDKDDYYAFVGTLHDLITEKLANNQGKPLKDEDYQQIGRKMLYQKMERGWFGSQVPGEPAYRITPSEEEAKRIREDRSLWTIDGQYRIPSVEWVNRYYRQQMLSATPAAPKPATTEPTKPPQPSITDRFVKAIEQYGERMRAAQKAADEAAKPTPEERQRHIEEVAPLMPPPIKAGR